MGVSRWERRRSAWCASGWRSATKSRCSVRASGQDPSFADILKMVHPKPAGGRREAFYGYMLGRPHDAAQLPQLVAQYERSEGGGGGEEVRGCHHQIPAF